LCPVEQAGGREGAAHGARAFDAGIPSRREVADGQRAELEAHARRLPGVGGDSGQRNLKKRVSEETNAAQAKLRTGMAEQTVLVALAHAALLHHGVPAGADAADALETAAQAVKMAYSQCPSYDALVPVLVQGHVMVCAPSVMRACVRAEACGAASCLPACLPPVMRRSLRCSGLSVRPSAWLSI
jgi:hypothetical protein